MKRTYVKAARRIVAALPAGTESFQVYTAPVGDSSPWETGVFVCRPGYAGSHVPFYVCRQTPAMPAGTAIAECDAICEAIQKILDG